MKNYCWKKILTNSVMVNEIIQWKKSNYDKNLEEVTLCKEFPCIKNNSIA